MCPYDAQTHVRLLARVVDEASDLVLITDSTPPSQGGPFIEYANESLLRATGYTLDELSGRSYTEIIAPDNDPLLMQTIAQNIECAHVTEKELKLRRKDGRSFWVEVVSKPLRDDATASTHWVSVGRDITLRKQSLEETLTLMAALDAVSGHLEIYTLDGNEYTAVFRNHDANSDISQLVETLLNEPVLREATGLRSRLRAGETVTVTSDGLQLRPCDGNAATLICIKQRAV